MTKSSNFDENAMAKAFAAAVREKKPNISKIAREFNVSRETLAKRVKKAKSPIVHKESDRYTLRVHQEKALINWIEKMQSWNLPPTAAIIQAWANRALARSGQPGKQVGKMWAYRFIKRLPDHLNLAPVKRRTKESKRIQAENAGMLQHWYDQLSNLLRGVPSRLVYNFDECGFQPGQGRSRNVIGSRSCPDLAESERGENITAVECIAADGWLMDPLFIFKASGSNFMETWYDGSEALPPNTGTAISPNGWISDELALAWLGYFITATAKEDRLKSGEKRYLIFDGHGAHLTLEFLQKCEDNRIVPFAFYPHSTHLCQPLDGKPFLKYKQQFRLMNNELSFWGGKPYGKADFLRIIQPIRARTFNQRIIRDSFKERGIWPVNGSSIVDRLTNQLDLSDLDSDGLRSADRTPSPFGPEILSSSVENSPPNTIEALERNQAKIIRDITLSSEKTQRNLTRIFQHQREKLEELAMTQDSIRRIRAAQDPQRRVYTKRQVKPLSQDGILRPRDANRSIKQRKEREIAADKRRVDREAERVFGFKPSQRTPESIQRGIDNRNAALERGELFWIDS